MKKVKGPLHWRLYQLLHDAWKAKEITQESLGRAIGQTQENTGQYLRAKKAGALDLDEARAALGHINSSLEDFLAGTPPPAPTPAQLAGRRLEDRPELITVVRALLAVPRPRLPVVIQQIDAGVFAATGRRLTAFAESDAETRPARRTTKGSKKRR